MYGNGGTGLVDYSTPLATTALLTWATPALTTGDWVFAVRAFDTVSGLEESNVDATVTIRIDAGLADVTAIPTAPVGLAAVATAGGEARVSWTCPAGGNRPTGFHVYKGTGGVPNYASIAATATAVPRTTGLTRYSAILTGLADGTEYTIGVRAFNATGEETNVATVAVTGDSTAPASVTNLTAS